VCRVKDVAPSTGYGEPVQKLFKFADGERIVAALALDPRLRPAHGELVAMTAHGHGLRFALAAHMEPSTRSGRLFARPAPGDEVVAVRPVAPDSILVVASRASQVLQLRAEDINLLAGAGRGVTVLKLDDSDRLLDFSVDSVLCVETGKGKVIELAPSVRSLAKRGGRGRAEAKRDGFARVVASPVATPVWQV
jgi:DNA gyrase subunit A